MSVTFRAMSRGRLACRPAAWLLCRCGRLIVGRDDVSGRQFAAHERTNMAKRKVRVNPKVRAIIAEIVELQEQSTGLTAQLAERHLNHPVAMELGEDRERVRCQILSAAYRLAYAATNRLTIAEQDQ